MEKRKVVIVSGYFNPIHKGHLELFEKSQEYGDFLIVIVNSDLQRKLKGSKEFMDENERLLIVNYIYLIYNISLCVASRLKILCICQWYYYYNGAWGIFLGWGYLRMTLICSRTCE